MGYFEPWTDKFPRVSRIHNAGGVRRFSINDADYRTNPEGCGLWVRLASPAGQEWRQILGTTQFSLNCSPAARRRRVVHYALRGYADYDAWRDRYGLEDTMATAMDYYEMNKHRLN